MRSLNTPLCMAILVTAGLLTFSACHKKEKVDTTTSTTPDTEQSTAADNTLAETTVNDIESMGSEVAENNSLSTFKTDGSTSATGAYAVEASPCATVTGIGSQTLTIDFGTTGCTGTDGRTRSGKLIYEFSVPGSTATPHYRTPGFTMHVTSQNYVVDSNHVSIINKTVINTTPNTIPATTNPGTNLTWNITASVSITKANGNTISWSCTRSKELTNTSDSNCYHGQNQAIDWTQAFIKLNGTSYGTNARGESFTATITNVLKDFTCHPLPLRPHYHPFIGGTIAYTPGTRPVRVIDFGSSCDNLATVTINGQSYPITLY